MTHLTVRLVYKLDAGAPNALSKLGALGVNLATKPLFEKKGAASERSAFIFKGLAASNRIIHRKFDGMRCVFEFVDFFPTKF
jgi:hypothetical protein